MPAGEVIKLMLDKQHWEKQLLLKGSEKATSRRERSLILNIRILTVLILFVIIALNERQYGNQKKPTWHEIRHAQNTCIHQTL